MQPSFFDPCPPLFCSFTEGPSPSPYRRPWKFRRFSLEHIRSEANKLHSRFRFSRQLKMTVREFWVTKMVIRKEKKNRKRDIFQAGRGSNFTRNLLITCRYWIRIFNFWNRKLPLLYRPPTPRKKILLLFWDREMEPRTALVAVISPNRWIDVKFSAIHEKEVSPQRITALLVYFFAN